MSQSEQVNESAALTRARDEAARHYRGDGFSTADSPDERTVPSILVGILEALIAIAERLPAVDQKEREA